MLIKNKETSSPMSFSAIVLDLKYLLAVSVIVSANVYVMIVVTRFYNGISPLSTFSGFESDIVRYGLM